MIYVSIVGLRHYIKGKSAEYFVGKQVVLVPEPSNIFDPRAVAVYCDGEIIGHVRKQNVEEGVFEILRRSKTGIHSAKVTCKSRNYDSLDAEVDCDIPVDGFNDKAIEFDKWLHCWSPIQIADEWRKLEIVTKSMLAFLTEGTATLENMHPLLDQFKELVIYGISSDFFKERIELYKLMRGSSNKDIAEMADELNTQSPIFHDNSARVRAIGRIMKSMKRKCDNDIYNYDLKIIKKQLNNFPCGLYNCYLKDNNFASRLYYAQVPRQQLILFLSGIAIVTKIEIQQKTSIHKKRKAGRPKNEKLGKDAYLSFISGDEETRRKWFGKIKELISGKRNKNAAKVMVALYKENIVDDIPFKEVKASFGDIGNKENYNKAKNEFMDNETELEYLRELIRTYKKELL